MKFLSLFLLFIHFCLTSSDLLETDVHNADNNIDDAFRLEYYDEFDKEFENLLKNDDAESFHPIGELSLILNQNASLEHEEPQQQPHKTNNIRLTSDWCPRFDRKLPTQKLSKPIVVPVFIGSYWCPAGDDTAAGATFTTEALSLQILLRDVSASWDIHFYLLNYMFLQPGFTLASHCITLTNSSYTQAGIEQTLNNWTTSGTLPGFMQKNYIYVLLFPPDASIRLSSGRLSCSSAASSSKRKWCAYHSYSHYSPGMGYNRYIALPYLGGTSSTGSCFTSCHFTNDEANYAFVYTSELQNTMSNPDLNSFNPCNGKEYAKMCPGVTSVKAASPPRPYNSNILAEQLWDTSTSNCDGTVKAYYVPKMWDNFWRLCFEQPNSFVAPGDLPYQD